MINKTFVFIIFLLLLIFGCGTNKSVYRNGMVVGEERAAVEIGREILRQGGNAADAAVAVGFALAVTYPEAGNLGGGGYMVARINGRNVAVDFREKAPGNAYGNMYLLPDGQVDRDKILHGALAAGVPGTVDGLLYIHEKFGTLPLKILLEPAIRLAKEGFTVSAPFNKSIKNEMALFERYSSSTTKFLQDGNPPEIGSIFRQPDLARTLTLIAEKGRKGFYEGETARKIVNTMKKYGGIITLDDLAEYRCIEKEPLTSSFKEYTVLTVPPSSSGGIIISEMLNMLQYAELEKLSYNSVRYNHYLTECFKRAYADRAEYLGDPDFVSVPLERLLSSEYAHERFKEIAADKASVSDNVVPGLTESSQTTHYNVIDKEGNGVAITTTINGWFGSGLVVEGAGFLLNNEMDDFSAKPGAPNMFGLIGNERNGIAPNKRMLSSQSPTVILKKDAVIMTLGAPGGSRIPSSVTQVILNVLQFGMEPQKAVTLPRLHHQWFPDTLYYEKGKFDAKTVDELKAMGHSMKEWGRSIGRVQMIYRDLTTGVLSGGVDPRADRATAAGY